MDIPSRIKARRDALGISQHKVAVSCGVTGQTVAAWEHGRSSPTVADLTRLAAALECRPSWLLDGSEPMAVAS